eukprot:4010499-Pyramimonas_sp.AAC.1
MQWPELDRYMRVKEGLRAACKNAKTPSPSGKTLERIIALISRNVRLLRGAGQFDPRPPVKSVLKCKSTWAFNAHGNQCLSDASVRLATDACERGACGFQDAFQVARDQDFLLECHERVCAHETVRGPRVSKSSKRDAPA